jgi:hypothetical protein
MTGSTFYTTWKMVLKTIFLSGFVAATLDMLAAIIVYAHIQQKTTALKILQSIASAVFGKAAYDGGIEMGLYGLAFHFFIAFCFAAAYCFFFPYVSFFRKHTVISGVLYGVLIWLIMNLVVLPIAFQHSPSFTWGTAFTGIIILIVAVGLPISFITHIRYNKHRAS